MWPELIVEEPRRADERWRPDLRWRLSITIGVLLSVFMIVAAGLMVRDARSAVMAEVDASISTALRTLDATLAGLAEAEPLRAAAALLRWRDALADSRHVCVDVARLPAAQLPVCDAYGPVAGVPDWFARGAAGERAGQQREVPLGEERYRVMLAPDAADEIAEAWAETRKLLLALFGLGFGANVLAFVLITRSLRPLGEILRAIDAMREGDFSRKMVRPRSPELQLLAARVRRLAEGLARSRADNRRLLLRNLDLQEEERRVIARELHDEIGQHVAAIDAESLGLQRRTDREALHAGLQRIRGSVAEIHRVSRGLLHRLRPAALDAVGLAASLQTLVRQWRERQADCELDVDIDPTCDRLDAQSAIHVYRIVQESLSNIARHAGASGMLLRVSIDPAGGHFSVVIADNGRGFDATAVHPGLGLVGIRERVEALGGHLELRSCSGVGSQLIAELPVRLPLARERTATRR